MICPHCRSDDTARCLLVYSQGTFSGTGTSMASSSYLPGLGTAHATSYESISGGTPLGRLCAPPKRPEFLRIGCLGLLFCIVTGAPVQKPFAAVVTCLGGSPDTAVHTAFVMVTFWVFMIFTTRYLLAKSRFNADLKVWARTWICLRCGQRWLQ